MSLAAVERVVSLVDRASPREARRLRRLLARAAAAPEHVRPRLLQAIAEVEPALRAVVDATDGPICPAYPDAPPEIQARIALGEPPQQISGGLTRAEAHRWLSESPRSAPTEYLLCSVDDPAAHELDARTVPVARWALGALADPARRDALLRERTVRGPHGEEVCGSYAQRLDEIRDPDLRPSVEATFRAAGDRMMRAHERALQRRGGKPLASVPRWWRPARCARLLLTGPALVAEGREMSHCVGSYAGYVKRGDSVIVSLIVRDGHGIVHRSTVELDRKSAEVLQHHGRKNETPPALCQRALEVLSRRWKEAAR